MPSHGLPPTRPLRCARPWRTSCRRCWPARRRRRTRGRRRNAPRTRSCVLMSSAPRSRCRPRIDIKTYYRHSGLAPFARDPERRIVRFPPMLIAQITDLHVRPKGLAANRVVETNMMTERAIDAVIALRPRPDVVLITGDLVDRGLVEEYEQLKIILRRLDIPFFVIPGNHDRRDNLRRVLADYRGVTDDPEFVQFVV